MGPQPGATTHLEHDPLQHSLVMLVVQPLVFRQPTFSAAANAVGSSGYPLVRAGMPTCRAASTRSSRSGRTETTRSEKKRKSETNIGAPEGATIPQRFNSAKV